MNTFGKVLIDNLLLQRKASGLFLSKDFKEQSFGQTVAALANGTGGDILLGVDEHGRILGLEGDVEQLVAKCMNIVRQDVSRDLPVNIQAIDYDGMQILLASVWEGLKKPYLYKDDFYVYSGDQVKRASIAQLNKLIMSSDQADKNWERVLLPLATMEDLDLEEVQETIKSARNSINIGDKEISPEEFLMRQGLIKKGMMTNACMMLFGKWPREYIPQAAVRLSVYSDNEAHHMVDDRIYTGNIFRNIKQIFEDFDEIYGSEVTINGLVREEQAAYPQVALREAVMNAVIHRDMSSPESFITIKVFASRTEITNSGELIGGITVTSLKRKHNSVLRNPDMAYVCYLRQLMELAGSGTLRIIDNCKENGFREPTWSSKSNMVKIVFPAIYPRLSSKRNNKTGDESRLAISGVREMELREIVEFIRKHPYIKAAEIMTATNKSMVTLKRNLSYLKSIGMVSYEGNNRTGGYVVNEE